MTKPAAGAQAAEDVQVLVERPYSHEGPHHPRPPPQQLIRARRPYYRRWSPWIVSAATAACVALFLVTMYVNDCPRHNTNCAAGFLGRFAFQPLRENPLLGPSSATYARFLSFRFSYLFPSNFPVLCLRHQQRKLPLYIISTMFFSFLFEQLTM
jgi:hypothetical protein